ncbi:MAG: hypothetical protein E6501_15355, partial [Bradyrhizobium sp.]|nr:hypothetical protein [Bradyrhizobium sp.]
YRDGRITEAALLRRCTEMEEQRRTGSPQASFAREILAGLDGRRMLRTETRIPAGPLKACLGALFLDRKQLAAVPY